MTSMTDDQQPRVLTLTRPKPRQRPTEDPPPPGAQTGPRAGAQRTHGESAPPEHSIDAVIAQAAAGAADPNDPAAAEMAAAVRELPALKRAVSSLGVAIIEVFSGQRAPSSLGRWVTPELYERIRAHASRRQALARSAPPRSTLATAGTSRVCLITPHVAEASVVVSTGRRHRAVALRLEHIRRRWLLTRIETA